MEIPALVITDVFKKYKTGTEALKGVSITVPQGDFFALLGANGAGKTSLIGIITGIVEKTSGTVEVFGKNTDTQTEDAKSMIGIVPQELNISIFETPFNIVVDQAGYYGIPRSVAIPRAEELFEKLGIADKMHKPSLQLSGGMKRRLLIARALIHRPKLLILDEPTAGVDVELRRGMWDFLRSLTDEGVTIVLTTHYLEEAEQLAKHVAIIHKGNVVSSGTMKDLLGNLKKERVFLDLLNVVNDSVFASLASYAPKREDVTTLSVEIGEGVGITDIILALSTKGVKVQTVRPKSGRLEEIFMNFTKDPV